MPQEEPTQPPGRLWTTIRQTCFFLVDQWLILAMGLVILLAYFFPSVGKTGGYVRSEYSITYGAVAIIFLISGLTLPLKRLLANAINWRLHLIVQVTSLLFIPAVFFGLAAAIESANSEVIESSMLVGLVITACKSLDRAVC
jgi:sodium/bile acid cotransporter 7